MVGADMVEQTKNDLLELDDISDQMDIHTHRNRRQGRKVFPNYRPKWRNQLGGLRSHATRAKHFDQINNKRECVLYSGYPDLSINGKCCDGNRCYGFCESDGYCPATDAAS